MSVPHTFNPLGTSYGEPWMKWTFEQWRDYVQHATENLPPFKRTPDAIKNATSVNSFFSDATATATTPVNYFRGSELPNWEYTNATNCDYFNCGNTSTVIGSLNAPNCTSAKYAFYNCTNMTELQEKVIKIDNLDGAFAYTKLGGDYEVYVGASTRSAFERGIKQNIPLNLVLHAEGNTNVSCALNKNLGKVTLYEKNSEAIGNYTYTTTREFIIHNENYKAHRISCYWVFWTAELRTLYCNVRHYINNCTAFLSSPYLTQCMFGFHTSLGNNNNDFRGTKLDLVSVKLLANSFVGLPSVTGDRYFYISVSKYKLSKDTSQAAKDEFPLFFSRPVSKNSSEETYVTNEEEGAYVGPYGSEPDSESYVEKEYTGEEIDAYNVGKQRYDSNGNILYVKQGGGETTKTSEAVRNSYVLDSAEGKIDISTVEDVSSFTDDDWEKYYGYPYTASNVTYYATGPLLKALRTISDRGWNNITTQYN